MTGNFSFDITQRIEKNLFLQRVIAHLTNAESQNAKARDHHRPRPGGQRGDRDRQSGGGNGDLPVIEVFDVFNLHLSPRRDLRQHAQIEVTREKQSRRICMRQPIAARRRPDPANTALLRDVAVPASAIRDIESEMVDVLTESDGVTEAELIARFGAEAVAIHGQAAARRAHALRAIA